MTNIFREAKGLLDKKYAGGELTEEELAKLVVEFMFYYLTYKGDIGSYEIKADEPLKWMGIKVETGKDRS